MSGAVLMFVTSIDSWEKHKDGCCPVLTVVYLVVFELITVLILIAAIFIIGRLFQKKL